MPQLPLLLAMCILVLDIDISTTNLPGHRVRKTMKLPIIPFVTTLGLSHPATALRNDTSSPPLSSPRNPGHIQSSHSHHSPTIGGTGKQKTYTCTCTSSAANGCLHTYYASLLEQQHGQFSIRRYVKIKMAERAMQDIERKEGEDRERQRDGELERMANAAGLGDSNSRANGGRVLIGQDDGDGDEAEDMDEDLRAAAMVWRAFWGGGGGRE